MLVSLLFLYDHNAACCLDVWQTGPRISMLKKTPEKTYFPIYLKKYQSSVAWFSKIFFFFFNYRYGNTLNMKVLRKRTKRTHIAAGRWRWSLQAEFGLWHTVTSGYVQVFACTPTVQCIEWNGSGYHVGQIAGDKRWVCNKVVIRCKVFWPKESWVGGYRYNLPR